MLGNGAEPYGDDNDSAPAGCFLGGGQGVDDDNKGATPLVDRIDPVRDRATGAKAPIVSNQSTPEITDQSRTLSSFSAQAPAYAGRFHAQLPDTDDRRLADRGGS